MDDLQLNLEPTTRLTIVSGQVAAGSKGEVIETLLGSCVAVCLRDPFMKVGGMNHYMLPSGQSDSKTPASFGNHAMTILIEKCQRLGGMPSRLEAKVFGGGRMMRTGISSNSVSDQNVEFALQFLEDKGIPILARDVGGDFGRKIRFHTDTGRVMVKRMDPTTSVARLVPDDWMAERQAQMLRDADSLIREELRLNK